MADEKKGRNKPRTTTQNIEKKKQGRKLAKKARNLVREPTAGSPELHNAMLRAIGETKRADNLSNLIQATLDLEKEIDPKRPSKGRNVPRKSRNGGAVMKARGGTFKGTF